MIFFSNSLLYILITLIIFYILRKKMNNPMIVDAIICLFWPTIICIIILYFLFKFVDKLAKL